MTTTKKIRNAEIFESELSIEVNKSSSFTVLLTTFSTILFKSFSFLISNLKDCYCTTLKTIQVFCVSQAAKACQFPTGSIRYAHFPRFAFLWFKE